MSDAKLQDRVTQLEETLTHHEHLVEQLNQVVIQLRADLEKMQAENEEQSRHLKWLMQNNSIIEDSPDEKPPHY